jgi:pilus assembly protein Flp/PilA
MVIGKVSAFGARGGRLPLIVPATLTPSQCLARIIGGLAAVDFRRMRAALAKAIGSDLGVTVIEYALIAGLISITIVVGATKIGTNISSFFNTVATAFP